MKHKILYLTYHPHIGGGETILISLLEKLNKKVFEPVVVVTKPGQLSESLKKIKIKTYFLDLNGYFIRTLFIPGMSPSGVYKFLKLTQKIKPDLIHLNHLNLAVYVGIVGKLLKVPVTATAHGSWDSIYFYQDIVNQIFIDKIFANTKEVSSSILERKIVTSDKVKTIYFGVDVKKFRPANKLKARKKLRLPKDKKVVSLVGRIDPLKDHLTFLSAANNVQKGYPDVIFLVVGSSLGDFSKTSGRSVVEYQIKRFLAEKSSLEQKIIRRDFVEYNMMPCIYNASDILVSSSLSESFGLTLAEGAACELPIVATNKGGQSLIVKNKKTGYLVPPENPEMLAEKIVILLKDKEKRVKFGQAARMHIFKNFPIEKYVKRVEEEYLDLIK